MRRHFVALAFVLHLAACGGGGSSAPAPASPLPQPPAGASPATALAQDLHGLALDDYFRVSYAALLRRSPETVVWQALGDSYPLDGANLDDLSETYRRQTWDMYGVVLGGLDAFGPGQLTPAQRLDLDVYRWHLRDHVDQEAFLYHDFPATYSIFGVPQDTRQFFTDIHPLATAQDTEDYVDRLEQVGRKFAQLSGHLRIQQAQGIVEPALTMQVAINQFKPLRGGPLTEHPYYTRFNAELDNAANVSAADAVRLRNRARAAIDDSVMYGYQRLVQTLEDLLAVAPPSIGVGQFPRGDDYYRYALRHHSTTDLAPAEVHRLGLDELVRIHAEMRLLFDQIGYPQNETLAELFDRVAADGGIIPAAEALPTFEAIIASAQARLPEAFDRFPVAEVIVRPDPFGGYYIGPSFDGTRPGTFYAGTAHDQPYFQMPSLSYHEAVPGHHTQIALAMEQDVPDFRKLLRFTGFVEGWALYAERLAWELGWYENDVYGDLGRLQYEALRAARLVMDTGIHWYGWSFAQAVQFNIDNVGWSRSASEGAAARYSVLPGQATAYMIGLLRILEERQRAMDALGPAFDLKAFHRALLSTGAVPLSLLDEVVDAYIAQPGSP